MGAGASGGAPPSADLESAEAVLATGETQELEEIDTSLVPKESEPAIAPKEAERALVNVIDKISPLEIFAECIMGRCLTVSQIVAEADSDNSGELEAEEWMNLCAKTLRLRLTPTQIMDVFEVRASQTCVFSSCSHARLPRAPHHSSSTPTRAARARRTRCRCRSPRR